MRTGETKGYIPPDAKLERRDKPDLSASELGVIARIEEMLREGSLEHLGSGKSADIEILPEEAILEGGDQSAWVIKRVKEDAREQKLLGISIDDEMDLQETARRIIRSGKSLQPDLIYADVPQTITRISHEKNQWLVMEYVPGDTLMERAMKEFIIEWGVPEEDELEEISAMKKEGLMKYIVSMGLHTALEPSTITQIESGDFDETVFMEMAREVNRVTKGPSRILTQEQYQAIHNTIKAFNKAELFHRDLHPSNIILRPDGTVSIIDFGLSVHKPEGERYKVEVGNIFQSRIIKLMSDADVLDDLQKIARKRR